ncbi:hypothetical protein TNCV_1016541 [Trichonephila clavipes]|uniref:Uncharacterized protein n=1 Tax=Trichonephila clavipes TaxID=2585209 RepID=A0A8X6VXX8_TRICX|nr:hypothetical protein TNCV_1016541 [Trichonephila clavipes]
MVERKRHLCWYSTLQTSTSHERKDFEPGPLHGGSLVAPGVVTNLAGTNIVGWNGLHSELVFRFPHIQDDSESGGDTPLMSHKSSCIQRGRDTRDGREELKIKARGLAEENRERSLGSDYKGGWRKRDEQRSAWNQ